jgi:hypothetical protein
MKQRELLKLVNAANAKIDDLIIEAIEQNETEILDPVRAQMRRGEKGDGSPMQDYSEFYAAFKADFPTYAAPFPKPDLYVTGDFHESLILNIVGREVIIDATDDKAPKLYEQYGDGITEISDKSIEEQKPKTTSDFIKNYAREIGLR